MKLTNNFTNNAFSGLLNVYTENCDPLKVNNNFTNKVSLGLPDVWRKDHKLVKVVDNIQQIAYLILLKIKIYFFGMQNKIKNLFKKNIDPKIYHHDLKEIINKGLAQRELNREGSGSNILHKERQQKKEIPTDNILEYLPEFLRKFQTIELRLKKFKNN